MADVVTSTENLHEGEQPDESTHPVELAPIDAEVKKAESGHDPATIDGFSNETTAGVASKIVDSKGKEISADEQEARRIAGTL